MTTIYKAPRYLPLGPILAGVGSRAFLGADLSGGPARPVALIWVPEDVARDPARLSQLQASTAQAALLEHPNVLRVIGCTQLDEGWARVTEFADGESLRRLFETGAEKGRPLPPLVAARLLSDGCAGVDHAAQLARTGGPTAFAVHGDLRPETVLISFDGVAKITGYGALAVAPREHEGRRVVHRRSYAAPEQLRHGRDAATPATDVYALGAILYEALRGAPPFAGREDLDAAVLGEDSPPLPPEAGPDSLRAIVARALSRDPAARFADAAALRTALLELLAGGALAGPAYVKMYLAELFPLTSPERTARRKLLATAAALADEDEPTAPTALPPAAAAPAAAAPAPVAAAPAAPPAPPPTAALPAAAAPAAPPAPPPAAALPAAAAPAALAAAGVAPLSAASASPGVPPPLAAATPAGATSPTGPGAAGSPPPSPPRAAAGAMPGNPSSPQATLPSPTAPVAPTPARRRPAAADDDDYEDAAPRRGRVSPLVVIAAAVGGAAVALGAVYVARMPAAAAAAPAPAAPAALAPEASPDAGTTLAAPEQPPARAPRGGPAGPGRPSPGSPAAGGGASPAAGARPAATPRNKPEPAPAAAPAAGRGATVEISAPAGSQVFIDGTPRGVTPLAAPLPISAGPHRVRVTLGKGVYETRLAARAGQDYTLDVGFSNAE